MASGPASAASVVDVDSPAAPLTVSLSANRRRPLLLLLLRDALLTIARPPHPPAPQGDPDASDEPPSSSSFKEGGGGFFGDLDVTTPSGVSVPPLSAAQATTSLETVAAIAARALAAETAAARSGGPTGGGDAWRRAVSILGADGDEDDVDSNSPVDEAAVRVAQIDAARADNTIEAALTAGAALASAGAMTALCGWAGLALPLPWGPPPGDGGWVRLGAQTVVATAVYMSIVSAQLAVARGAAPQHGRGSLATGGSRDPDGGVAASLREELEALASQVAGVPDAAALALATSLAAAETVIRGFLLGLLLESTSTGGQGALVPPFTPIVETDVSGLWGGAPDGVPTAAWDWPVGRFDAPGLLAYAADITGQLGGPVLYPPGTAHGVPVALLLPAIAVAAASLETAVFAGRYADALVAGLDPRSRVARRVDAQRGLASSVVGAWALQRGWGDVSMGQIAALRDTLLTDARPRDSRSALGLGSGGGMDEPTLDALLGESLGGPGKAGWERLVAQASDEAKGDEEGKEGKEQDGEGAEASSSSSSTAPPDPAAARRAARAALAGKRGGRGSGKRGGRASLDSLPQTRAALLSEVPVSVLIEASREVAELLGEQSPRAVAWSLGTQFAGALFLVAEMCWTRSLGSGFVTATCAYALTTAAAAGRGGLEAFRSEAECLAERAGLDPDPAEAATP